MRTSRILSPMVLGGAVAALLAMPAAASAAAVKLTAALTGAEETGGGDSKGSGTLTADVDADSGDFCYTLVAKLSDKPTMAHIHAGPAGDDGPPVVTLQVTGPGNDECVAVEPEALKPILAKPGDFYVNVHTASFPKGAVRGQLKGN